MAEPRRVVVTGLGVVSSLGETAQAFWAACLEGVSPVEPIPVHWSRYFSPSSPVWAPLAMPDFRARGLSRAEAMQNDPVSLLAACAALEALGGAGVRTRVADRRQNTLALEGVSPGRAGVFVGTGIGGVQTLLGMQSHQVLANQLPALADIAATYRAGPDHERQDPAGMPGEEPALGAWRSGFTYPSRFNPFAVAMSMPNATAAYLGIKLGLRGANQTHCAACASATVALGHAFRAVRSGALDCALAGGSEYLGDHYGGIFRGFDAARTLVRRPAPDADRGRIEGLSDAAREERSDEAAASRLNRPFDARRSGFLFSEGGAAMLFLESEAHAAARGAAPLAEVSGFAESFDAYSMMSMEPSGAPIEAMLQDALADAGITAGEIDYINAHGTGTELNDVTEAAVIERIFGTAPLINSTKSIIGHTIGASGALEAVVAVLSLRDQTTHRSLNLDAPIVPLNFVTEVAPRRIEHALSQSFAFGGHNAGLVLRRV